MTIAALLVVNALAIAAPATKPTVAVLYFDYEGKNEELGLLRKGLAQMLISDLAGDERYEVVERDRLQALLDELKLNQSKKIDRSTANRMGKLLGARFLVLGGYFDLMGRLRVDARVVEVETGKVVKSIGAFAAPDEFIEIERKLAGDLSKALADLVGEAPRKPPLGRGRRPTIRRPAKLLLKTALDYSKALDAKDNKDPSGAKKALEAVVAAQPDFALAQLDLNALIQ